MGLSILDYINRTIEFNNNPLTKEEFTRIRNYGSQEELEAAIEKMEAAGGYDNLD